MANAASTIASICAAVPSSAILRRHGAVNASADHPVDVCLLRGYQSDRCLTHKQQQQQQQRWWKQCKAANHGSLHSLQYCSSGCCSIVRAVITLTSTLGRCRRTSSTQSVDCQSLLMTRRQLSTCCDRNRMKTKRTETKTLTPPLQGYCRPQLGSRAVPPAYPHVICMNRTIHDEHEHAAFILDVAKLTPPATLSVLLRVLHARGEVPASPSDRKGILPLAIPLTNDPSTGDVTALLRWPTPPEGLEMPLIRVRRGGNNQGGGAGGGGVVFLLAKAVDDFIHRCLVEEDAAAGLQEKKENHQPSADTSEKSAPPLTVEESDCAPAPERENTSTVLLREGGPLSVSAAAGEVGEQLYKKGTFGGSRLLSIDAYLTRKVGLFPDVLERLALNHLDRGDEVSALVAAEFYCSRKHFPGFGRPFGFNAELFKRMGRLAEAKDAARVALRCPWWTLGSNFEEMADIAGYSDERIELLKERVTEEARQEDITKGKSPEQVSLDQAAFLLDTAAAEGNWDDVRDQLGDLYQQAGLTDLANFIKCGT